MFCKQLNGKSQVEEECGYSHSVSAWQLLNYTRSCPQNRLGIAFLGCERSGSKFSDRMCLQYHSFYLMA